MRAKLSGKIRAFREITQVMATDRALVTEIDVVFSGKIESEQANPNAKVIEATVTIRMKPVLAETLRFGQTVYLHLSTDEPGGTKNE